MPDLCQCSKCLKFKVPVDAPLNARGKRVCGSCEQKISARMKRAGGKGRTSNTRLLHNDPGKYADNVLKQVHEE